MKSIISLPDTNKRPYEFWDEANPGDLALVPCWPTENGDAIDCPNYHVLVGVIDEDGLFRSEAAPPFHPGNVMWLCPQHGTDPYRWSPFVQSGN